MENNFAPMEENKPSTLKKILPYIIIVVLILIAGAIYLQKNNSKTIVLNTNTPTTANNKEGTVDFNDYGPAPEFTGIYKWLNSENQSLASLKGKVVLVDFWTYSCINCIRTLPYVTKLYDTYKDKGLVVIGVHTPEFAFEKETSNVQDAIKRFNIHYPVAQDNDYKTWEAYKNQYWPAEYLINQEGKIVYMHFGEGNYDVTEKAVQQLLQLSTASQVNVSSDSPEFMRIKSPEMYFGLDRLQNLSDQQRAQESTTSYTLPKKLNLNEFALEGKWQFDSEKARLVSGSGKIKLEFSSGKVHMVAMADKPVTVKIFVDGKAQKDVTISQSELYTLFDSEDYREHTIEIQIPEGNFDAFTFTFG